LIQFTLLYFTDRPEPPRDVRVLSCTTKFVELTWVTAGDNNSPIIDYVVYYTDSSTNDPEELIEGPRLAAGQQGLTDLYSLLVFISPSNARLQSKLNRVREEHRPDSAAVLQ